MPDLSAIRTRIRTLHMADEAMALADLAARYGPSRAIRDAASARAEDLVRDIRGSGSPGLMEVFLAEYGLSTDEGVALMCLAEALLRVPDAHTIDELIEDKIAPSAWGEHLGQSSSPLVNASTWALMLTGKVLQDPSPGGLADTLRATVKRLGEPVIRAAITRAMKEMGHQFVLGEDIAQAVRRGQAMEDKGYTYSYDMLGEAALTAADALGFLRAYGDAIAALGAGVRHDDIRDNPGISIKLSALHPRYEFSQRDRVMSELVPRVKDLALMAKTARMGLNIDAEEADRLDLSLDVIEAVLRDPRLAGWDGFGVVVQAYGKRAPAVIDWLHALATDLDRSIMVRLVKGAYWDTEIKRAQVDGVADFPVFTRKAATDVSYLCCARKLLDLSDRIYPQFATHNAHTVSTILQMAAPGQDFEFQRLHGMGEVLHQAILDAAGTRCRIYAPVGAHKDLLAYLVRRLLENGANSSFVNQIVDDRVDPADIAADPFEILEAPQPEFNPAVIRPADLFQPERVNSTGWDLRNADDVAAYQAGRDVFADHCWAVAPMIAGPTGGAAAHPVFSPQAPDRQVGSVAHATLVDAETALARARPWEGTSATDRQRILNRAADLYEANAGEIFAALTREAGKTALDAIAELREAVDFLRYYGAEATRLGDRAAQGVITCISPWNFPLAIFSGQIAAALAAGNGVLAKPADPTPIVASIGVRLMHQAGVPPEVLQLLPGKGAVIGARITTDPRVRGICFTGSTGVARTIYRGAAGALDPASTFIAETGGLNAMIVDSTALPEQAVQDIVDSAFRSAGQRCSALRMLYLQEDIAEPFLTMLCGAMDELDVSDPWAMHSDVGPVITDTARQEIADHIDAARRSGRLVKQVRAPEKGHFIAPAVIRVAGIAELEKEIFGPVLHVATFAGDAVDRIIGDINATGYGLTFGLHTRIDDRVQRVASRVKAGNLYVNRNQIGAVVGSQPFGGEGLSGTGPKAGGPLYLRRFCRSPLPGHAVANGPLVDPARVEAALHAASADSHRALDVRDMPGPTGESNRWSLYPRGTILCLGPTPADVADQMAMAAEAGCACVGVAPGATGPATFSGYLDRAELGHLSGLDAVALWSTPDDLISARVALAKRDGPLLALIATRDMRDLCVIERHLCVDTTAAGGNASLLAAQ
ncbi:MAG: bifunctional proline dehydrogenase/L-glutamate gamma-semialdehyde dehydrogenase PutA [Marinibacterium sp.]